VSTTIRRDPDLAQNHLHAGVSLIGLTSYMFDARIPLFIRGLSLFHVFLPLLLIWLLYRLGYDSRAFFWQTLVAAVVLPLSYFFGTARDNVNWVHGFGEKRQTILPAPLFVICLLLVFSLVVYLPMHLLFDRVFGSRSS
jgi:hypothetical protein